MSGVLPVIKGKKLTDEIILLKISIMKVYLANNKVINKFVVI